MFEHRARAAAASVALTVVACGSGAGALSIGATPDASSPTLGGPYDAGGEGAIPDLDATPSTDAAPILGATDGASGTAIRCAGKSTPPRDQTITVSRPEGDRTANVHVPTSYSPSVPMAVVLDFHAYLSDATLQDAYSGMSAKADVAGFVAVHPQGIGNSWNAGACCGEAESEGIDDVGFVRALLDALDDQLCVDADRIFATGMSNGGFFAHRVGCELADRVSAIAPVAGVLGVSSCTPARPVAVLDFHGNADTVVPYEGSAALGFASVDASMAAWVAADGCGSTTSVVYSSFDAQCVAHDGCDDGTAVELCTIFGGGHTWPGGVPIAGAYTAPDLSATDAMWTFFVAHAR